MQTKIVSEDESKPALVKLLREFAKKFGDIASEIEAGRLKSCCGAGAIIQTETGDYEIDIEMHFAPAGRKTLAETIRGALDEKLAKTASKH